MRIVILFRPEADESVCSANPESPGGDPVRAEISRHVIQTFAQDNASADKNNAQPRNTILPKLFASNLRRESNSLLDVLPPP